MTTPTRHRVPSTLRAAFAGAATAALLALSPAAHAHGYKVGEIAIGHPWARATTPGQPSGGGYMKLENGGSGADRLTGATTARAERVELHEMWMEGDVMRMRRRDAIELPPGGRVELKPGGAHLMLIGLTAPLTVGEKFPMTLAFEKAGTVEVTVNVQAGPLFGRKGASAPGGAGGHGGMHH